MTDPILEVSGLETHYSVTEGLLNREVGRVRAVDGVDLAIDRGEAVGLVGESGCGKSTALRSIVGLEEPTAGTVTVDGRDVTRPDAETRRWLGRRVGVLFQDAASSFDPRMTVGESVGEPLLVNGVRDRERRRDLVAAALERVDLERSSVDRYPHELSGGQLQRAGLARALVVGPELLVADEPVSSLDVSVRATLLSLLSDLRERLDLSVLLVSHDLSVVREFCDRVAVMYLGEIVERGPTEALFDDPAHPYTRALVASIPSADPRRPREAPPLSGEVPSAADPPAGCRFHTRCPELIRPKGLSLERSTWLDVAAFLGRVRDGSVDPDAVATVSGDGDADRTAEATDRDAFDTALRSAYDLPARLEDDRADAALTATIARLHDGDREAALEVLESTFTSVCHRHRPEPTDVEADRSASCHLLERPASKSTCPENE